MIYLSITDGLITLSETTDAYGNILLMFGKQDNIDACKAWASTHNLDVFEELPVRFNKMLEAETIYQLTPAQTAMFLLTFK